MRQFNQPFHVHKHSRSAPVTTAQLLYDPWKLDPDKDKTHVNDVLRALRSGFPWIDSQAKSRMRAA